MPHPNVHIPLLDHVLAMLEDVPVGLLLLDATARPLWFNDEAPRACAVWNHGERPAAALRARSAFRVPEALLAACQSSPPVPARTAGGELLCTRETPVGTNVPVTRCRTRAGAEQERVEARDTRADIGEKQDLVAQPIK